MGIIETKALLLQDIALCRRIMFWALFFIVFGCIQDASAAKPSALQLAASTTVTTGTIYAVANQGPEKLTCSGSDTDPNTEYKFNKNGEQVRAYEANADYAIANFDSDTHSGKYTCIAKNAGEEADDPSADLTLTLDCTSNADDCGDTSNFACDGSNSVHYCKCERNPAGVFPSGCNTCGDGTCSSNTDGKKKCSPGAPPSALPRKCVECLATNNNDGCNADSNKPRCDVTTPNEATCQGCLAHNDAGCVAGSDKPKCLETAGTCVECIKPSDCKNATDTPYCVSNACEQTTPAPAPAPTSPVTNTDKTGTGTDSKGTTTKSSVTSSAETVTSTACLVIASVVLALMI